MNHVLHTILCAVDLGPRDPDVLRHAAGLAGACGARLYLLNVVEPLSDFTRSLVDSYVPDDKLRELREEGFDEARRFLGERLEEYRRTAGAPAPVAGIEVLEGHPAKVILEQAERLRADLIVLGSHGHSALGEMLIGSVAHRVTLKSRVPVLLIPVRE